MTSSSSSPPSPEGLVGPRQYAVRNRSITSWKAGGLCRHALAVHRPSLVANTDTCCSSALKLSNAPNPLPGVRLQQVLGGEYHETCFCICWSGRVWRGCTIEPQRPRCLSPYQVRPRKHRTLNRSLMSATDGVTAGTSRATATVTTTRITSVAGAGTAAGDTVGVMATHHWGDRGWHPGWVMVGTIGITGTSGDPGWGFGTFHP